MLAMRTAGPNWNYSKLFGSFAAEWPSLCCNLLQRFGYDESVKWPLDDVPLREDYYYEALAFLLPI